jgi:hypothetical protein
MTTPFKLMFALAAVLAASQALAEKKIVKWTDEKGVVHYGNAVPGSQTGLGSQKLNSQGIVTNTQIDQKNVAAAEAAKRAAEEQKKLEAKRILADQQLLDAYATEADIARDYQQNVELLDQQIKSSQIDIESRQLGLNKLIATAGESERAGKPVPEQIKVMIATERAQIEQQRKYVNSKKASQATAKKTYEDNLARYREVMARNTKQ